MISLQRLACLLLLAAGLSGCAFNQYTLDIPEHGGSVRMAQATQTLNPNPPPEGPVEGMDGVKARVLMEEHQVGRSREAKETEKAKSSFAVLKEAK